MGRQHPAPDPLVDAHYALAAKLDVAINEYAEGGFYSKPRELCRLIDGFVHQIRQRPECDAELERRILFIESSCRPGTEFRRLMGTAFVAQRRQPKHVAGKGISGARLVIQALRGKLRSIGFQVASQKELADIAYWLERARDEKVNAPRAQLNQPRPEDVRPLFDAWLEEAFRLRDDAAALHVDGCGYLWHVYQGRRAAADLVSRHERKLIETGRLVGDRLALMKGAAKSLLDWSEHNAWPAELPTRGGSEFNLAGDSQASDPLWRWEIALEVQRLIERFTAMEVWKQKLHEFKAEQDVRRTNLGYNGVQAARLPLYLSEAETFALLAAFHDNAADAGNRIDPWRPSRTDGADIDTDSVVLLKEGTAYAVLRSRVEEIPKIEEQRVRQLLVDVEVEFRKACSPNVPPEPLVRQASEGPMVAADKSEDAASTRRQQAFAALQPAEKKAYWSFIYAEGKVGKPLQDREAYAWLKENGIDDADGTDGDLDAYELPTFDTWARQLRAARNALEEQKYTPRHGRGAGRSIAQADQI